MTPTGLPRLAAKWVPSAVHPSNSKPAPSTRAYKREMLNQMGSKPALGFNAS